MRPWRRRHLREPDYTRPPLAVRSAERERIVATLTVLYGEAKAAACYPEVERLMQVHWAHKPAEMLRDDAEFDPRDRFTQDDVVAITYGDLILSPGMHPLKALTTIVEHLLGGVFTTIHLLPFFPYSSDRGFSVIDYEEVDPRLGSWEDIERLSDRCRLMMDGVINHVSSKSEWFREFRACNPHFEKFFISFDTPRAIDEEHLRLILRPRTSSLLSEYQTLRGPRWVWTTFSPDQIDLNFAYEEVLFQVLGVLLLYVRRGANVIRLDAATYLWREIGTTSAHLPQTHALVQFFRAVLDVVAPQVALVTETNVPHDDNVSYFGDGNNEAHLVYNFALPPLVLWTFHSGDATKLTTWLAGMSAPSETTSFLNFLDSHDGVGLLPVQDILTEDERTLLIKRTYEHGGLVSYRTSADGRSTPYELNIPWYNALNRDDDGEPFELKIRRFVASRAIALAVPGVPAVYLPSLVGAHVTAGHPVNEKDPRSINRNSIDVIALLHQLDFPDSHASQIMRRFEHLIRVRASCPAFHPGAALRVASTDPPHTLCLLRESRDGEQLIVALTNVTATGQEVSLPLEHLGASELEWRDVLTGIIYRAGDDGVLRVPLDAYDVVWLERQPRG